MVFENYWAEFSEPDEDWLTQYEVLYTQAAKPSDPSRHLDAPKIKAPVSDAWIEYVARLKAKNEKRLEWIARQLPEVTAIGGGNWQKLTKDDAQKLLGISKGYGGLGRLIGAGVVKNIFYEASWKNLKTSPMHLVSYLPILAYRLLNLCSHERLSLLQISTE